MPGPERIAVARVGGEAQIVASCGGRIVSLSGPLGWDHTRTTELIRRWEELGPRLAEICEDGPALAEAELEWEPPIMPSKLICVGANYTDHVEEMERAGAPKVEATPFPFSFLKPPSTALVGSGVEVSPPAFGKKLDWEAELAVVIGDPERAGSDPLGAVFG